MTELFSMNDKDLDLSWEVVTRPSVRGIIIKDEKVLLIYSKKYNYYKFPGGGINNNESNQDTLIREVKEESGYIVIPESIEEYGVVIRRQKDNCKEKSIFEQKNYYYICQVMDKKGEQELDAYEKEEGFSPVWITPLEANLHNRKNSHGDADINMIKRETKVLDLIDKKIRKDSRIEKENIWIDSLGKPCYKEMLDFVRDYLMKGSDKYTEVKALRYNRFEHIKRVLAWSVRLYEEAPKKSDIDIDTVIIAAIFHDVGKNEESESVLHADRGAEIARQYLLEKNYPDKKLEDICYLIKNHSDKYMMYNEDVSPELLLLMEADLMDDMGALGIVIDCMIEGTLTADFRDSLDHIARYTVRQHKKNPMVTPMAIKIWDDKTKLVNEFYSSLQRDVEIFK